MSGSTTTNRPSQYYIDERWDAAIDSTLRHVVYGSVAGGVAALLFFRGPSARAASVAFGAGFGAGGSYFQNQKLFHEALGSSK